MKNDKDIISTLLNDVKDTFWFINLKNIDVLKVIKEQSILISVVDVEAFKLKLTENVFEVFYRNAGQMILDDNNIINDIINSIISNGCECNIKHLDKIMTFFGNMNLSKKEYEAIINHNQVNMILKNIITEDSVSKNYFLEITSNLEVLKLLEIYCDLNEVTVIDDSYEIDRILSSDNLGPLSSCRRYLKDISRFPVLTNEQVIELGTRIKYNNDEFAKKKLFESNLRLVVWAANRNFCQGLSLEDLIQEGNIGLMKAVERFDVDKGFTFSTYAMHWINQRIKRAIKKYSRMIKIPDWIYNEIIKYRYQKQELFSKYEKELSLKEIASELNLNLSKVIEYEKLLQDASSLNVYLNSETDSELIEFVEDSSVNVESIVLNDVKNKEMSNVLNEVLNQLSEKQRIVLKLRYGLLNTEVKTLEETADILYDLGITTKKVTRERVRQIQEAAIKKLKKSKYSSRLEKFI